MKIIGTLRKNARLLKDELMSISYAVKDKRTPLLAKILIAFTIAYLLSPIDLIPDFIPILGLLDDLILVPILISLSLKLVPNELLVEYKSQDPVQNMLSKPKKYLVATLIITIWIGFAGLIFSKIFL